MKSKNLISENLPATHMFGGSFGPAYEDAGAFGATPYVGIIVFSIVYIFRPMMILWASVFVVFVAVASHPQNGPLGEWIIFILIGLVPAILLWFARPRRLERGGCKGSAPPSAEP